MTTKKSDWEVVREDGDIKCPVCGMVQSPSWGDYCVYCCPHSVVDIGIITGDHGWDEPEFTCRRCKKNFFDEEEMKGYICIGYKRIE
jgi:hypothetical protein